MDTQIPDYDFKTEGALAQFKKELPGKYPDKFWDTLDSARGILINTSNYVVAMKNHSWLVILLNDLLTRVTLDLSRTDSTLTAKAAKKESEIREDAVAKGLKMTNDAVKSQLQSDDTIHQLESELSVLKALQSFLQGYVYAAKDRSEMLRELSTNERVFLRSNT